MSGSEAVSIEPEGWFESLKRSEYDRMIELGLFQDERVELIRGVLVKMSPQLAARTRRRFKSLNQLVDDAVAGTLHPAHPVSDRAFRRHGT